MKYWYKIFCIAVLGCMIYGCGAKKHATQEPVSERKHSDSNENTMISILEDVEKKLYSEGCMERKLSLAFGSHSVAGTMRMEKGKRIWLNITPLGISFARAVFTPDSLMYYERIKKTAFSGRWDDIYKISDKTRVMNYQCLENIFTARPIFTLTESALTDDVDLNNYVFSHKDSQSGFSIFVYVNKINHRIKSQMLVSEDEKVGLLAEYEYGEDDNLPSNINFTVLANSQTTLLLTYGPAKTMTRQFPFRIPEGYSDIKKLAAMLGINM